MDGCNAGSGVVMRLVRGLSMAVIASLLAIGAAVDLRDRPLPDGAGRQSAASLHASIGPVVTWFCPGGSGADGLAELTVELISASDATRTAVVTAAPDPSVITLTTPTSAALDTAADMARRTVAVPVPPGERVVLSPVDRVPGAWWVGAVVEIDGSDVVVEQVVADGRGGVGRSACLTRTARQWVVPHGATRFQAEGERLLVMLLNPFPDFAVADVEMIGDVGRDSVDGLVVPAGAVVAVDVTNELTVARSVLVLVEAVSGRLAVSSIQLVDGPTAGRGTRVAPAVPEPSPLWYLPVASVGPDRRDIVAVANPSPDQTVEVDIEIITDEPWVEINPIELVVAPGRTSLVDLRARSRLEDVDSFTVVVRSLTGVPVAASTISVTGEAAHTDYTNAGFANTDYVNTDGAVVSGTTATAAADAAARHWLIPAEVALEAAVTGGESVGFDDDVSNVVIVNPSAVGIALVDLMISDDTVRTLELGPQRRARVPLAWLGSGRFVLKVVASSPVIAAREVVGFTSRTASLAVAASEPVRLVELR